MQNMAAIARASTILHDADLLNQIFGEDGSCGSRTITEGVLLWTMAPPAKEFVPFASMGESRRPAFVCKM